MLNQKQIKMLLKTAPPNQTAKLTKQLVKGVKSPNQV